jgi:4-alpha-glucanotransferase
MVKRELGTLPFVAEGLGVMTPDVTALRDSYHLPGMRVLQFAFDGNLANPHLPHKYLHNLVAYTATHNNNTSRGWSDSLSDSQQRTVWQYLARRPGGSHDIPTALIQLAWSSNATLAVSPLQDLLNLGTGACMNVPGQGEGNWRWRYADDMLTGFTLNGCERQQRAPAADCLLAFTHD